MIFYLIVIIDKKAKRQLRAVTVDLNGYFKVPDFRSVLQTFFPAASNVLKKRFESAFMYVKIYINTYKLS
jgi:hypothetical protein